MLVGLPISHLVEPFQAHIHLKQKSASTPEQKYAAAYLYSFLLQICYNCHFGKFKNTG